MAGTVDSSQLPTTQNGETVWITFLIFIWYSTSSVAVLLTKSLFSGTSGVIPSFPFSLLVTASNNIFAWLIASIALRNGNGEHLILDGNIRRLSVVIGTTTAGEVGLSNIALNLLSVSYATVLKGMAPLFVMAWGVGLGLNSVRIGLVTSMVLIVSGVILTVVGQSVNSVFDLTTTMTLSTHSIGFVAQLISCMLSGCRWVLTQIFIKGERIDNNGNGGVRCMKSILSRLKLLPRALSALETIRCTTPFTILALLPALILLEGVDVVRWFQYSKFNDILILVTVLTVIGTCVAALLWAEYELVKVTSSLTVSVAFVFKEVLVIYGGRILFKDSLTQLTWLGFVVVQAGIVGYAMDRLRNGKKESHHHETEQP